MEIKTLAQYTDRQSQLDLLENYLTDPKAKVKLRINDEDQLTAGVFAGPVYVSWTLTMAERSRLASTLRITPEFQQFAQGGDQGTNAGAMVNHRVWVLENA